MKALLVPVKSFMDAKLRLSPVLPPRERAVLARQLARGVITAAGALPVSVVCDDHDVASFAESLGARVIWTPGLGLSLAVQTGVEVLSHDGASDVIVAHADLPLAEGFEHVGTGTDVPTVTIVPDRTYDGTNVISVPAQSGFCFSYGPRSFSRHVAEARRLGLDLAVLRDDRLAADVDVPRDLVLVG